VNRKFVLVLLLSKKEPGFVPISASYLSCGAFLEAVSNEVFCQCRMV
jgi:hypothetical protein